MVNLVVRSIILLMLVQFISCSNVKQEQVQEKVEFVDCINDDNKDVELSWGRRISSQNRLIGYKLKTNGALYRFDSADSTELRINYVSKEVLCDLLEKTRDEFVKVGALNVPADTTYFVIYDHPAKNLIFRAQWNPLTPAIGSKGFRDIWEILETTYPDNRILLHEEDR